MLRRIRHFLRRDDAAVAVEAGMLFPLMVAILCATLDLGTALMTNLKVVNASQIVGDLVSRGARVTDAEINDAIVAGRMALIPYNQDSYGVDIVGIQFVGHTLTPTVRWRETVNMDENDNVLEGSEGLGLQGEGVVAVTVQYMFRPYFTGVIFDDFTMTEESYVRGRKGLFVERENE